MADCVICARESSDEEPPGGWVLRTDLWSACVAEGFEVPGWLFLQLRRHAEGPMGMDDTEAAELGVVLTRLTAGIQAVTDAERVYIVAYGELFPHFHLLLMPRLPFAPDDERGPGLFLKRAELADPQAAAETATRVCAAVSAMP
jgi:diadenosine tetraphosphate (Ap4A) HIT family hydrolase